MSIEPKIYVADLAAYNNSILHGVWIDAGQDLETIQEQVRAMLAASPEGMAEEFAIHDYEGFGSVSLSEYEGLESVNRKALFIEEFDELGAAVLNHFGDDLDEAKQAMEERYNGEYESLADYARQLIEETGEIPDHLEFYIDYERMGRDMELSGDIYTIETGYGEVHVFWSC
ncbi:MAG: antirestriction protein ArdA [Candidatus Thiodiazotropha sp. (ex Lucinoma kastoroae)]|nr:antirestriction protein ArdA [Candidatus Thiodiazotropha sp. (ex Lucinoma kastoroae)]